jgi:arabinogalactan oligomer/maltooligosaccharide transport system permease protein
MIGGANMESSVTQKNERLKKVIKALKDFSKVISDYFSEIGAAIVHGDARTKLSVLIMGFGNFSRGQIIKGLIYLALEISFICYFVFFGWTYLKNFNTLGVATFYREWDEANQIYINVPGDNSLVILLFSVLTLLITAVMIFVWLGNIKSAYRAELQVKQGKKLPDFKSDMKDLLDKNLHITMLSLPALGVIAFTLIPIIFMICMAFTNFDRNHQPPGNLFTWVGFNNFKDIFWQNPVKSRTFFSLLGWTFIWAVCATFLNYILGMIVAMMINKKGIKFKGLFRTCFVIPIAVPAFVTLMFMQRILGDQGTLNVLLMNVLEITDAPIKFLSDPLLAKITVIIVNLWIGIPYTMLITSGVLMNIPQDLYESARIDGAGPVTQFVKITLPYMLFVTTPYLITQFIGNINNFNAIFLLTGGQPLTLDYYQAGKTDLLVTWLYKLTVDFQDYNLASTIGIMIFGICATVSLLTFNITSSAKKEETFQ